MMKVMRKRKKLLLGIFGAVLMVMFLLSGPQSIFQPDPLKQVVATVGTREVKMKEMGGYESEFLALKDFAPLVMQGMQIESAAHWMLLSDEARKAGLVGDAGDGRNLVQQIAEVQAQQLLRMQRLPNVKTPEDFQKAITDMTGQMMEEGRHTAAGRHRLSIDQFDRALAKLQGVVRLRGQYNNAIRISDRRGISDVKQTYDAAVVNGLVIPASRMVQDMPEPTEQQIQEHYQKYRDVKPGEGEFGFGYVQPPRIKYEYVQLNRDDFKNAVKLDPVAVSKYYLQNRATYKGDEATETPNVRRDLINLRADQMMTDAERLYTTRLKPELRNLPSESGFKKLPADWKEKGPRIQQMADAIRDGLKASGHDVTPRVVVRDEAWHKVRDLGREADIGGASFRVGTSTGDFRTLTEQMHELNATTTLPFQARVPSDNTLTDVFQNRYYVNVLDWRPESAPESIEEVRQDVVRDIKLKAAYDKLVAMQDDLKSTAISTGLDTLANSYDSPAPVGAADPKPRPLPVFRYATVSKEQATGELNKEKIREAVLAQANSLGVKLVASPQNQPERTLTVPLPKDLSVAVVEILGHRPITQEDMRTLNSAMYGRFAREELLKHSGEEDPFSFKALEKRYKYKAVREKDDKQPGAPKPPKQA